MQQPPQQRLRGEIVLAWPRSKMKGLYARLAEWGAAFTGIGTFEGPFGNRFRLVAADEVLAPLPDATADDLPPGGDSEGLGILSVRFDAPRGTSGAICEFYSSVFGATAEAGAGGASFASARHRRSSSSRPTRWRPTTGTTSRSTSTAPRSCAATELLKERGLVFENRRFLQFTCRAAWRPRRRRDRVDGADGRLMVSRAGTGTLADAMKHDEFRVKDIAGNDGVK